MPTSFSAVLGGISEEAVAAKLCPIQGEAGGRPLRNWIHDTTLCKNLTDKGWGTSVILDLRRFNKFPS
jgi:hypothetical protein